MGGKEKEGRVGGRGEEKGGEGKGDRMWRGPESGLPQGPCWLSAGLVLCISSRGKCEKAITSMITRDVDVNNKLMIGEF